MATVTYVCGVTLIEAHTIDVVPNNSGYRITHATGFDAGQLKAALAHPAPTTAPVQAWRRDLRCGKTRCGGCAAGKNCLYETGILKCTHQPLAYTVCAVCADGDCGVAACSKGLFLCIKNNLLALLRPDDAVAGFRFCGIVQSAVQIAPHAVEFKVLLAGLIARWPDEPSPWDGLSGVFQFTNVKITVSAVGHEHWAAVV
jgi:hypothetical protein